MKNSLLSLLVFLSPIALADDTTDHAAIIKAAQSYAAAWYTGDGAMMSSVLHPALAKRAFLPAKDGSRRLSELSAEALAAGAAKQSAEFFKDKPKAMRVEVYDVYENVASVRLTMDGWIDYMHLVRVDGEWKIINVLWELHPAGK